MKSPSEALAITRNYWGSAPVDVFAIARDLELGPIFDAGLEDHVSGLIRRREDGNWEILVNANHSEVRQRFTVAHESGHFIYHRDRLALGTSDTLAYRTDEKVFPNPLIGPTQEWQANNFAANLLIPDHYLRAAQAQGMVDDVELARAFKVSRAAMRIKLGLPSLSQPLPFANPAV
jgi:hypothetical protein